LKNISLKNTSLILLSAVIISAVFIAADGYKIISAKSTDICLSCHEDKDLYMEKNGKKISLYVNPAMYKKSVHSIAECEDCHSGYNPDEIPHTKSPQKVECKTCHSDVKGIETSVHAKTACYDCHTKHEVISAKEFAQEQSKNCMKCHTKKNIQQYKTSIHAKKDVGCEGCHLDGHNVKKITKTEISATCGRCHGDHQKNFNNSIHQTILRTGNKNAPTCSDCHGSHQIISSKMSIESESCLKCHLDEKMFPGEDKGSAEFVAEYKTSIHASIEKDGKSAAGCSDCHGNHMIDNPENPKASLTRAKMLETCGRCHASVVENFKKSKHGEELIKNNNKAPSCTDCHGEHSIKSTLSSDQFSKLNQVDLCLKCHQETKLPHKNYKGEEVLISHYKDSYHYKALLEGKTGAASCADCHGAHEMKNFDNPDSKVYKKNIAQTCGQSNCHVKQLGEFEGSIHDVSIMTKENSDAPTCTGCHGNHQILKKDEGENRIANSKGLVQLCSNCHNSVELTEKYNLPSGRTSSYMDSFHGLAVRGGSKVAANCESCHGNHSIRPSTDSLSTISKKNLPETCGKCNPGATTAFFNTPIHIVDASKESPVLYWVRNFYLSMIFGLIGGMVLHNVFDFFKKFRKKK
jgi:nitrate/TMAO reductase-like tetraheme cytochrome c subunit